MTLLQEQQRTTSQTHSAMRSFDGTELFYRAWLPAVRADKALLLVHRGHEHSGRFEALVEMLDLDDDVAIFALDARGHGRSPGERGYAPSFGTLVRDLDTFARFISREHGIAIPDMIVLGQSIGAVIAAAWVHDYAPPLRAMILATPALRVKLYVPFARPVLRLRARWGGNPLSPRGERAGVRGETWSASERIDHRVWGFLPSPTPLLCGERVRSAPSKAFVKSYVRPSMLTHDRSEADAYAADPLISRQIAVNILLDLHDVSTRLLADAGAIRTPALILAAGSDWVVHNSAIDRFFEGLSSSPKELHTLNGFRHAIFHESRRDLPIAHVRRFSQVAFQRPTQTTRDLRPDPRSVQTFDRLSRPLSRLNPKRAWFASQKLVLKTIGRTGAGVRLGWRSGFSSGESLDHVYQNTARGFTPLGRLIDRLYLDAVGWRAIRQRKQHLQQMLSCAIEMMRRDGQRIIRILDIASGPGRYLLEVLDGMRGADVEAMLRDRDCAALEQGRTLAAHLRLGNVRFVEGDAFDPQSLARIAPPPDIAVVSGLYELFPDNAMVLRSLRAVGELIPRGGLLLYTNQPWHPQLEMIARVLIHSDGSPWVMRCRPQYEMDSLVRAAGFEKLDTLVGDSGICTVSLARRI